MSIHVYTDGGARGNPGPGGIGVLVCNARDEEIVRHKDYIGHATNNIAEYCAIIAGLEIAKTYTTKDVACFLDSELVVKQLNGEYKVKNDQMKKLNAEVRKLILDFEKISFTHVPRSHAKMQVADFLVNEALDESGH
jgi:ribonuclease HI